MHYFYHPIPDSATVLPKIPLEKMTRCDLVLTLRSQKGIWIGHEKNTTPSGLKF